MDDDKLILRRLEQSLTVDDGIRLARCILEVHKAIHAVLMQLAEENRAPVVVALGAASDSLDEFLAGLENGEGGGE
jgi:hypothetical protein